MSMNELYKLPDGWEWKKFDEVSKFIRGITFKPNEKFDEANENTITCFRTTNIQSELDDRDVMNIDSSLVKSDDKIVNNGDILISSANSLELLGKCCLVKNINYKATLGGFIVCGRANANILDEKYFYYFFSSESNQKRMRNLANKTTGIANLPIKKVEKEYIPIPSLSEQQRIVSKLDFLFQKIDKSIGLHQKNMDEANAFMGSALNEVFGELEEKYGLNNIGNMIEVLTDYHSNGAYKNLKENVELLDEEDYALMIRATDLENEDYIHNVKYITESAYTFMSKSKIYGGEIILPKIGTIGNVYFMPYLDRPTSLAMNLFMLRCSDKVMNKYMFLFLKSPIGHDNILSRANGAVTKTITKDAVRSIELPFPPLPIQQKVVEYLDSVSEKMDKVKSIQKEKMESLKALKASILDKAFRGEL